MKDIGKSFWYRPHESQVIEDINSKSEIEKGKDNFHIKWCCLSEMIIIPVFLSFYSEKYIYYIPIFTTVLPRYLLFRDDIIEVLLCKDQRNNVIKVNVSRLQYFLNIKTYA